MSLNFLFSIFAVYWFAGCAEKRAPDDELVREYLYEIKPIELWYSDDSQESVNLDAVKKIMNEKFLRKFMRLSEMEESKFVPICVEVATKAVQDAGFFMNNSKGRKNFESIAALKAKSPDEHDKLIKERCGDSLRVLKGRAHTRESEKRRANIATDSRNP